MGLRFFVCAFFLFKGRVGVTGRAGGAGISEVVSHNTRTVSNDISSLQKAINAELETVKKDVRDVHNTIRNSVVRNNQVARLPLVVDAASALV